MGLSPLPISKIKPQMPVLQTGHPLARGLLAYWPFTEGGGNTVLNLGRHNASLEPTTTLIDWDRGDRGHSFTPNATDRAAKTGGIPNSIDFPYPQVSFAILFKADSAPEAEFPGQWLIEWGDGFQMNWDNAGSGQPTVQVSRGGFSSADMLTTMVGGQWYLCVGTYEDGALICYIDGLETDTNATPTGAIADSSPELGIGSRANGNEPFRGEIAFAAMWDRVLAPSEVKDMALDPWGLIRQDWQSVAVAGATLVKVVDETVSVIDVELAAQAISIDETVEVEEEDGDQVHLTMIQVVNNVVELDEDPTDSGQDAVIVLLMIQVIDESVSVVDVELATQAVSVEESVNVLDVELVTQATSVDESVSVLDVELAAQATSVDESVSVLDVELVTQATAVDESVDVVETNLATQATSVDESVDVSENALDVLIAFLIRVLNEEVSVVEDVLTLTEAPADTIIRVLNDGVNVVEDVLDLTEVAQTGVIPNTAIALRDRNITVALRARSHIVALRDRNIGVPT